MTKLRAKQGENADRQVIADFGDEWTHYDQDNLSKEEKQRIFESYFSVFCWQDLPADAEGFDAGCGSGRWADLLASRVGRLHCIEPSAAIEVAKKNLAHHNNCFFHAVTIDGLPFADSSMDFAVSLGVLHHIPDTSKALTNCARKLKPGAPFLLYLYYKFDNRPAWFRLLWRLSDVIRRGISRLPCGPKLALTKAIAILAYWPLARAAELAERTGINVENWPLSIYRRASFYTMCTDALDRFGTRLEQRFSRGEIENMMRAAGLVEIRFSDSPPYHCAVGIKA